jgi:hypothetical protein
LPEAFAEFLLNEEKGPKIDHPTLDLRYGVMDQNTLVTYSLLPLDIMMAGLINQELKELSHGGLNDIKVYGNYLTAHN